MRIPLWLARVREGRWPMWLKRKSQEPDEVTQLMRETKAAWSDYEAAHVYFNYVTDPQLVDHSIYRLEAAGKRFSYLWSKLRTLQADRAAGRESLPINGQSPVSQ